MVVNIIFDDTKYADIISVPNDVNIEELQVDFLKWLFDKNNNHKYWVCVNGEKLYCNYGTEAFVEWINANILSKCAEKATIITENNSTYNEHDVSLTF